MIKIELNRDEIDTIIEGLKLFVLKGKEAKKGKSKAKQTIIDKNFKGVNDLLKFFQGV